jgi:hypothetical protein
MHLYLQIHRVELPLHRLRKLAVTSSWRETRTAPVKTQGGTAGL